MLSLGPRLSGAFSMCVPDHTPVTQTAECVQDQSKVLQSTKALLKMTRGETNPIVLQVRKVAFGVMRRAYHAIRVARNRQRCALLVVYSAAARVVSYARAKTVCLSLSQLSYTLDPASLS